MLICLIASVVTFTTRPMTWIDGSTSRGSVAYQCKTETVQRPHDVERESLKARIEIMKKKGLG